MRFGILRFRDHPLVCKYARAIQDYLKITPRVLILQNVESGFFGNREIFGFRTESFLNDLQWKYEVSEKQATSKTRGSIEPLST